MNLSFGSMELNRSNASHLGTSAIGNVSKALNGKENASVDGAEKKESFRTYLLEAVNEMNSQQCFCPSGKSHNRSGQRGHS